jgi:hypothetical protein
VLGERLSEWVTGYADDVGFPEEVPNNPLEDRDADNWESLLAIADAAGGDWPMRARQAAKEITANEVGMSRETVSLELLRDLVSVWQPVTSPALLTSDILRDLWALEGARWDQYYGRGFSERDLAEFLKPYEVRPTNVNVRGKHGKGYRRDDLFDAWERYLADDDSFSEMKRTLSSQRAERIAALSSRGPRAVRNAGNGGNP